MWNKELYSSALGEYYLDHAHIGWIFTRVCQFLVILCTVSRHWFW